MIHQVLNGDCLDVLRGMADNSVDSIVIERDTEYVEIIRRRLAHAQGVLFSRNDD
jgi:DNA modification methylase